MNVLIANFGGIGNGAMTMPILIDFARNNKYEKIYCTRNAIFDNKKLLALNKLEERVLCVDTAWRRFDADDWTEIGAFLKTNGIGAIYNFRNEGFESYAEFAKAHPEIEFHDFDYAELVRRKYKRALCEDIFDIAGVENGKNASEWLSALRKRSSSKKIGMMISASQANKKMPLAKWKTLAQDILEKNADAEILIFSGKDANDIDQAGQLLTGIGSDRCAYFGNIDLYDTIIEIGGLDLLISNDTGLLHVAAAIGIKTIGIYLATDPAIWRPNTFAANACCTSSSVGKCGKWKYFAGTCGHFYGDCLENNHEDVSTAEIYADAARLFSLNL